MEKIFKNLEEALLQIAELENVKSDYVVEDLLALEDTVKADLTEDGEINFNEYGRVLYVLEGFRLPTGITITIKDTETYGEPSKVEVVQFSEDMKRKVVLFVDYL